MEERDREMRGKVVLRDVRKWTKIRCFKLIVMNLV